MWFLIIYGILFVGFFYIGWRMISPLHLHQPYNSIAWIALFLLFLILPLSMFMLRSGNEQWTDRIAWFTYTVMGFLSFLFTLLLIKDVLWVLGLGGHKLFTLIQTMSSSQKSVAQLDPNRRLFLTNMLNLGVLSLAGGFTMYGIFEARRRPSIIEVDVPLPHLPDEFDGFRIVQITDIHAGLTVKRDFVETIVGMVADLKADLIAFTGDLVDGSVAHLRKDVEPLSMLSAPHGKFFITGNHEYYSGAIPWIEEAKRLGFDVLLNEHRVIERGNGKLLLAGVTDFTGGQFIESHKSSPEASVANAPQCDSRILLAHQPKSLFAALPHNFDLLITGHTHGGQFFPWNLIAAAGQPYIKGLHKHENTWIYVSKGTGYWGPPVRVAARSEITVLRLVRG